MKIPMVETETGCEWNLSRKLISQGEGLELGAGRTRTLTEEVGISILPSRTSDGTQDS